MGVLIQIIPIFVGGIGFITGVGDDGNERKKRNSWDTDISVRSKLNKMAQNAIPEADVW